MAITRRQFLHAGAAGVGAMAVPLRWGWRRAAGADEAVAPAGTWTPFTTALPRPEVVRVASDATVSMSIQASTHVFQAGQPAVASWCYTVDGKGAGGLLGPTFDVDQGARLTIAASNELPVHLLASSVDVALGGAATSATLAGTAAAVHLHGGNTAAEHDGLPWQTLDPGTSRTYVHDNAQDGACLWYHDHAVGITRLNVMAGLAGFYLVRDDAERALAAAGLPLGGSHEVPLVLQDRTFTVGGAGEMTGLWYPPAPWTPEFFGNTAVVNGAVAPHLEVDRSTYRFRVINGSNARFFDLSLSNRQPMVQIGGDGGLLPAPVALRRLLLAPGERADVLIDFGASRSGERIVLANAASTPFPGDRGRADPDTALPALLELRVSSGPAAPPLSLPGKLRPITRLRRSMAVRVRDIVLNERLGPDGTPTGVYINDTPSDAAPDDHPAVNTVELWNIVNTTVDAHPIHLHLVQFQVFERQRFDVGRYVAANPSLSGGVSADPFARGSGMPPDANELGWKDTVRALPGQITRLLIPFGSSPAGVPGPVAIRRDHTGRYVYHCHILEHEENDMMRPYDVS